MRVFDTGSSLATCWRKPNLEYSKGEHELTEGCCLVNGGVSFGFGGDGWHAMEAVQCMVSTSMEAEKMINYEMARKAVANKVANWEWVHAQVREDWGERGMPLVV